MCFILTRKVEGSSFLLPATFTLFTAEVGVKIPLHSLPTLQC